MMSYELRDWKGEIGSFISPFATAHSLKHCIENGHPVSHLRTPSYVGVLYNILIVNRLINWYRIYINSHYSDKKLFNIAWRNIVRHKGYSAVDVAGLTVAA